MEADSIENLDQYITAYQGNNLYDFDNEIILNWYPKRVIKAVPKSVNQRILELGLGHGITTRLFSKTFKHYTVLDGSRAVIDKFLHESPNFEGEIIETYFEDYQTDEHYDVILMGFILEHVESPAVILKHYKPLLKPNGRIFIAVPNAEVMNRRLGNITGDLPSIYQLSEHDRICGHKRYYTLNTLTADIEQQGFRIESAEGIYLKPLSTRQMIGLNLDESYINALCELGISYPELSCALLVEASIA